MKKVWKGAAAAIAALSLGVTGFVGASSAYAVDGDTGTTQNATTGSIKITPKKGHTYKVYQVLTGSVLGDAIGNPEAGDAFKTENGQGAEGANMTAKEAAEYFGTLSSKTDTSNAADTAREIAKFVNFEATTAGEVSWTEGATAQTITGLTPGYYFIRDTMDPTTGVNDTESVDVAVVVAAGDTETITPKDSSVTVEKKVKDQTLNDDWDTSDWQDSADYSIGDWIPFQLTGTLPSKYEDYTSYYYKFIDTPSTGLDLTWDTAPKVSADSTEVDTAHALKVYLDANKNGTFDDGDTDITSAADVKAADHTVTFDDLKTLKVNDQAVTFTNSDHIVVEYWGKLNNNAIVTANNPATDEHDTNAKDHNGNPNTVKVEYSRNPNGDGHGTTPEDKVTVFSFELIWNKKDDANKFLSGAEFTLYRAVDVNDGQPQWGDDEGVVIKPTEGHVFTHKGLGDGIYKLVESKTPTGYNTMADLVFQISATHETDSADPQLTQLTSTYYLDWGDKKAGEKFGTVETITLDQATKPTGHILFDIENKKGSELPSTGGMGTVVLYTVGGLIVLIAGVGLAIALRRRQA